MYKRHWWILLFFIICLSGVSYVSATSNSAPLLGKVIYLDPGHGGLDPGAMYKNIMEKDINLEISKKLDTKLSSLGAIVYQTRYGDYDLSVTHSINRKRSDLSRRGNIINDSECDLYLSIHLNAEETSAWRGAQVFYDDINPENIKIGKIMQEEFSTNLYSRRKMKKVGDLYLSRWVKRPGVLLELGFLSNPNDRYLLKSSKYQDKLVDVITGGVLKYFKKK